MDISMQLFNISTKIKNYKTSWGIDMGIEMCQGGLTFHCCTSKQGTTDHDKTL